MQTRPRRMPSVMLWGVILVTSTSLRAQGQTWIVDQAGGPGSHFTDIGPALQIAQRGDTILVRSGTYDGGSITRGIAVLAEPGAGVFVRVPPSSPFSPRGAFEVENVPAGQAVVIDGFRTALPSAFLLGSLVLVRNCAGRVHLSRLEANLIGSSGQIATGVSIQDAAHVSIHASTLRNGRPMNVQRSTVLLTESTLVGQAGFNSLGGSASSSMALAVVDGHVTIARSLLVGGSLSILAPGQPSPAISSTGGLLRITGGAEAGIRAGSDLASTPTHAIGGLGTSIFVDPRVTLTANGAASTFAPGHGVTIERRAALSATAGPPGGTLALELLATAGDGAELYLSVPSGPIAFPTSDLGELWIDVGVLVILGRFPIPPSETVRLSLPIPVLPGLRGAAFTSQAVTLSATAGVRFGTPVTFVLN